jgi:hypothetical protein
LFQAVDFTLIVDEDKLELQDSGTTVTVQFGSFKSILRYPHYYAVKLPGKMTVYLKSNQLSENEIAIINKHLTA